MNLNIVNTKDIKEISDFVAGSINRELDLGKRVIWFATGGSSIKIEAEIAKKIKTDHKGELVVTLTDERFGSVDHPDSNWFQLKQLGFDIPNARMIPFLTGKNFKDTTLELRSIIKKEFENSDYKIGMFGLGLDGHIAGILPRCDALNSGENICSYDTAQYDRITITPQIIMHLDEAILCAIGDMKWPMVEKLEKDISFEEQPAQIIKKVPLLTIFTDMKME